MNWWLGWAAAAAGAALAGSAQAQAAQGLEVGLQGQAYRYTERFEGAGIRDTGPFAGLAVAYGRPSGRWMFEADLESTGGSVDYRSSDGVRLDDVDQYEGRLQILAGRRFAAGPGVVATAYTGLGSRVLLDESGGRTAATGEAGYDRELRHVYLPLGASVRWARNGGRFLTLYAQHNQVLDGEVRTELSDAGAGLPDFTLESDGHGWELGARWTAPVGRGRIGIQPFARWWELDASESVDFSLEGERVKFFEPESKTRELGVRVTYGF